MPDPVVQGPTQALRQVWSRLSRQPRILLTGGVVIGFVFLWFLYAPPLAAIRRSGRELHQVKMELADVRRIVEPLRKGQVPPLPGTDTLPTALEQLNALARSHEVQVLQCTPGDLRFGDPAQPAVLPVELLVEGEYRSLGEFLGSLSQAPSLGWASVRRLSFERDERFLPRLRGQLSVEIFLSEAFNES